MTWDLFKRNLNAALLLRGYPSSERKDILRDYKEMYELGLEEGKSGQQLCSAFGSPAAIAKTLSKERKAVPKAAAFRLLALGLTLLAVFCYPILQNDAAIPAVLLKVVCMAVLPFIQAAAFLPPKGAEPEKPSFRLNFTGAFVMLAAAAACYGLMSFMVSLAAKGELGLGIPAQDAGMFMNFLFQLWAVIGLAVWGVFLFKCSSASFPMLFFAAGNYITTQDAIYVLHRLDSPEMLVQVLIQSAMPLIFGAVAAAVLFAVVFFSGKGQRGKIIWMSR